MKPVPRPPTIFDPSLMYWGLGGLRHLTDCERVAILAELGNWHLLARACRQSAQNAPPVRTDTLFGVGALTRDLRDGLDPPRTERVCMQSRHISNFAIDPLVSQYNSMCLARSDCILH